MAGGAQTSIPLGAMEKWLLLEQARDAGHYTNWLLRLDRALDADVLGDALTRLRPRFPVHFSTLGVSDDRRGIEALYDPARPIVDFLAVHDKVGVGTLLSTLLNDPLDPVRDGFFRCHMVTSPTPMLAAQSSHVAGDGFTNSLLREALMSLYGECAAGATAHGSAEPELGGYGLGLRDIKRGMPAQSPGREIGRARPARRRDPCMRAADGDDAVGDRYELRTFRARLDRAAFRGFFRRAAALEVGTLAYLGACLAVAADRCFDPWAERDSDFIALSFPRDLRTRPGWSERLGNLVFPFGIPLQRHHLVSLEETASRLQSMAGAAAGNWIYYRIFAQQVRSARDAEVPETLSPVSCLEGEDGRAVLRPLPAFGVTELPHREVPTALGDARVLESYFQSPIIGRRYADGSAVLAGNVRWHPSFDTRIREFLETFVNCIDRGDPEAPARVVAELIAP